MADDKVKDVSLRQYVLHSTLQHFKYIIDDQKDQIDFLKTNMKVDEERIDDLKEENDNLLEKIYVLRKTALANREMANAQEAKANTHEAKDKLFLT